MMGAYLAGMQSLVINLAGEFLTVERRPAAAGGSPTFQTVQFIVEELQDDNTGQLRAEGNRNVGVGAQKMFICAIGSDVQAVIDMVIYEGDRWKLLQVTPERHNGTTLMLMCVGANSGKAT